MHDFRVTWELSRGRFIDSFTGLSPAQLNWRLGPNTLSIGEMAVHVAGVELSFANQLLGGPLSEEESLVRRTSTEGVVDDLPFPVPAGEITPEFLHRAMELSLPWVDRLFNEGEALRQKELKSALGPIITGEGAFARLAMHPLYHQGQAYLIRNAPGFPSE